MTPPTTEKLPPPLADELDGLAELTFGKAMILVQLHLRLDPDLGFVVATVNMNMRRLTAIVTCVPEL